MIAQLQDEWRQAGVAAPVTVAGNRADPLWDRLTEFASGSARSNVGKGDGHLLCEAPSGPFRQKVPVPFSDAAGSNGDGCLAVRIHVLPGNVASLVKRLRELDPHGSIQAHAGSGVVLAHFSVAAKEAAAMVDQRLRPEVRSAGGAMVVLAQPEGAELSRETLFGPVPEGWAVMQSIQRQFDPKGILNRGRFLFAPPA
jgi:FAD/FMN-containing dehydrogenase